MLTIPPLVRIEVLSPGDTLASIQERCNDYFRMGMPHVWIVDPVRRSGFTAQFRAPVQIAANEFVVPGTPIRILLEEVFAELDEMLGPS